MFSWLQKSVGRACQHAVQRSSVSSQTMQTKTSSVSELLRVTCPYHRVQLPLLSARLCSTDSAVSKPTTSSKPKKNPYEPPSPYKNPGPHMHGYRQKLFTGGLLPRLDTPIKSLPKYKPKDRWTKERALFGQNDYIDILGDKGIHPVELIRGPKWVVGFNGNEMQRLIRRMKVEGHIIRQLYPTTYHRIWKRVKFLYKKYNQHRGKRN